MNKTLKRRVFRHTALYAAILMFSHTGGGGGGGGGDGANPSIRYCHERTKSAGGKVECAIFNKGQRQEADI
ncbi:pilus-associated protein [Neisseria gonorrhoeae]|nr:pilus-associated protein [Neisseria gonorrhoeae]CNT08284.1 pilus-associated protein [Neisseria gonorrhoeae]